MAARLRPVQQWTRRLVRAVAVVYPITLVGVALGLRYAGESWWVSTVGLYLPRIAFGVPLPLIAIVLWAYRMRRMLSVQIVSVLLLVFPVMGFVLPGPVSAEANAPTLRVLSLNANGGSGGIEAIVDAIGRYSPDVVLLQETASKDALVTSLNAHYPMVTVSGEFILATRFPLVRTVQPDMLSYEGAQRSPRFIKYELDTSLGPISFYSVHPISPREGFVTLRGEGLRREIGSGRIFGGGSAHLLELNTGLRALQVRTFSEAAALETGPVVIAGDTNLPDPSPLLRRHLARYDDAFVSAGWGFGYTFPTNKWRPWMRIDRVLASGALCFTHFEIGRPVVSDHHFVVADLQRASGSSSP